MSGSLTFSSGNAPAGYVTPPFPSLTKQFSSTFWGNPYSAPLLFYSWDVYRFSVYWCLIISFGFHMAVAAIACLYSRRLKYSLWILLVYGVFGAFFGFVVGSLVGVIGGAVYRAGALHVSTWTPFSWALLSMAYMIMTAYPVTSRRM